MRWLIASFVVILAAVVAVWDAAPAAPPIPDFVPAWGEQTPLGLPPRQVPWRGLDEHAAWSAAYLSLAVPYQDWPYIRFLSWNAVPEPLLADCRKVMAWWLTQMTFKQGCPLPYDVPGTKGRLQYIDIRSYGWNAAAWQTVAERETYTREEQAIGTGGTRFLQELKDAQPQALALAKEVPTTAEFLRKAIGYKVPDKLVKDDKFPLVAMVWTPWLFRETVESDRSPSYYDLLFAKDRFVEAKANGKLVEKSIDWKGGDFVWPVGSPDAGKVTRNLRPGRYTYEVYDGGEKSFKFVNFPANEKDWEKAFGIDVARQFAKDQKIDVDYGAVVQGGQDIPNGGSIVALHNRLLLTVPTPSGGAAMKTFDTAETSGERDFAETAAELPFGKIVFDAAELLAYLPNGGQAGFLTNAKGERLEIADNRFAKDTADTKMDARVRNPGSCVICHAPSGGYILPRNLIEEMLKEDSDFLKIKDREKYERVKAFYLGWEKRVKAYTTPYEDLVAKATADKLNPNDKGWSGAKLAGKFLSFRNFYDDPITADQAAAEMGLEPLAFKVLCLKSPKARPGQLIKDGVIPRRAWEQTTFREMGLFLSAQQH